MAGLPAKNKQNTIQLICSFFSPNKWTNSKFSAVLDNSEESGDEQLNAAPSDTGKGGASFALCMHGAKAEQISPPVLLNWGIGRLREFNLVFCFALLYSLAREPPGYFYKASSSRGTALYQGGFLPIGMLEIRRSPFNQVKPGKCQKFCVGNCIKGSFPKEVSEKRGLPLKWSPIRPFFPDEERGGNGRITGMTKEGLIAGYPWRWSFRHIMQNEDQTQCICWTRSGSLLEQLDQAVRCTESLPLVRKKRVFQRIGSIPLSVKLR